MIIKILSYNMHKGFTWSNKDFVLAQMRKALRELNADVLFLQEVVGDHSHDKHKISDWETSIQFEYLADTVWPHFSYGKNAIYDEGHHGNAILSKFPIITWDNHVISTNRFEQRGCLRSHIQLPNGQELVLANTHFDLLQKGRNLQAEKIIDILKVENKLPWILVGDFNDWNSKVSPLIEKKLNAQEVFKSLHGDYPPTFPAFKPILSLDRVFCHKIKPLKAVALTGGEWAKLSDHLPLYVEFEIPDA